MDTAVCKPGAACQTAGRRRKFSGQFGSIGQNGQLRVLWLYGYYPAAEEAADLGMPFIEPDPTHDSPKAVADEWEGWVNWSTVGAS